MFSHLTMVRPLGFGLAIGVLLDAFVVRMLLIPAVMHLLGEKAWWLPKWLDRILPNVDVEGAALERTHPLPGASSHLADRRGATSRPRTGRRQGVPH
jgi:RND superfamily putative drug exporter